MRVSPFSRGPTRMTRSAQAIAGISWAIDYDATRSEGPLTQLPAGSTFTRASVAVGFDHLGRPFIGKSGEIVEWGKRRVENLLTSSKPSTSTWIPNGSVVGANFTENGYEGIDVQSWTYYKGVTVVVGSRLLVSVVTKHRSDPSGIATLYFDGLGVGGSKSVSFHADGSYYTGGVGMLAYGAQPLADGWLRLWGEVQATSDGVLNVHCYSNQKTAEVMIELAAGQTEPSEYVSNGVLSAPYHGWGVDGVKYFNTDENGDPILSATMRGIICAPQQTNIVRSASDLTQSIWTKRGTVSVTAASDAVMGGTYTQVRGCGAAGANDVYTGSAPYDASVRFEPCLILRAVSTGTLLMQSSYDSALGQWQIDLSAVSDGDLVNREHPAVTVVNEFMTNGGGNVGVQFAASSGTVDFDVSMVTVVAGAVPSETPIPNTSNSAAATRNADSLVVDVPDGGYDINTTYGDGTSDVVSDTASSGLTLTSADFSKATVKKMQGNPA